MTNITKNIDLSNKQKKFLRKLGHSLSPVVAIGQHGLTQGVLTELELTMEHHELLKIKIRSSDNDEKQQFIDKIISTTNAQLIQVVGSIILIYRSFSKDAKIILPRK